VSGGALRVLLTLPSLAREFGGPVDHARALRDALRARGISARLVGAGAGDGEGLPVIGRVRGTPIPRSYRRIRTAIGGADIVHVLGYRDPVGTSAASVAFHAHVPYLLEPCGMMRPRVRSIAVKRAFDVTIGRPIIDRAATIIATSRLERSEMIEDGVPPNRIQMRLNGITVPPPAPRSSGRIRARLAIPPNAPLVLALGRITRKKALPDLVEAVSRLPTVYLLIAGPDANDGTLSAVRRRAWTLNGRLRVDVRGLWGHEKFEAFAEADCFALPSQTENFGNAAAEAAAVGLPVVVSEACGVAEVLDPSAHRVIGVGDVDALTAAVLELISGDEPKRGAEAAARALRNLLDWSSLVDVQLDIYRKVLAGGSGIGTSK
jgi:glycosyltransferase involved in cell wall biosynthesis